MAAITTPVSRDRLVNPVPICIDYLMDTGAGKIPAGALVALDSTGYAVNAGDTSGDLVVVGVAVETVTYAASGDTIKVDTNGIYKFTHATGDAAITEIGDVTYVKTNNEIDDASAVSNNIKAGIIVQWDSVTEVWITFDLGTKWAV